MCGRFTRTVSVAAAAEAFGVDEISSDLKASYNIAPTQKVAVIVKDGKKKLIEVRWGLVPSWAKDISIGNQMINARAETITQKASFKNAFKKRRCLIVADGFYEWQKACIYSSEIRPAFWPRRALRNLALAGRRRDHDLRDYYH